MTTPPYHCLFWSLWKGLLPSQLKESCFLPSVRPALLPSLCSLGWLLSPRRQDGHYLTSTETGFPTFPWEQGFDQSQSPSVISSPGSASLAQRLFSPVVLSVMICFIFPPPSLSKPLVNIKVKDHPSLLHSIRKCWLSTFCVLGIRKGKKRSECAGEVRLKEEHSREKIHIGKRK